MTVIAGLIVLRSVTLGQFTVGTLGFAAPVILAAVAVYVRPLDRRFTWAALAIAASPVVILLSTWLPDAWLSMAPGDWKNATPLLFDLGGLAGQAARFAGLAGLALFGLALGGVRTFMSAVIIGFGVIVAAANTIWFVMPLVGVASVLDLVLSIGYAALHIVGWAFVFAAALESLRPLTLIGTGLLFADAAINAVLVMVWRPEPGGATDLALLVFSLVSATGWGLLITAVLRGELSEAPARSRVARGNASPRRAG